MRFYSMNCLRFGLPFVLAVAAPAFAGTIYSTGFESGSTPTGITGAGGVVTAGSVNGTATYDGNYVWQNTSTGDPASATTLTITGLAANQDLSLELTFLAIGSWDGSGDEGNCCTPDYMNVSLNSSSVFQAAFRNYGVSSDPEYPGHYTANGYPNPPANTTVTQDTFCCGDFGTSIYDITITGLTADSGGNATFQFFASGGGWQGSGDESVGLDNITVTSSAAGTPEPGSALLLLGGVALAAIRRRR